MTAAGPDFYDAAYSDEESTALLPWDECPLAGLFHEVRRWMPSQANVIDLGCGTGQFAQALAAGGHQGSYVGLDFSAVAIDAARELVDHDEFRFHVGDLRTWSPPVDLRSVVFVCLETLEHLDDDLGLLERLPTGRRVMLSVPSFVSAAHVRHFPTVGSVFARYERLLELRRWSLIRVSDVGAIHAIDAVRRLGAWGSDA